MTQYFKVLKGSETFQKITDLFERIAECNKANREFAESIGADVKDGLLSSSNYAAGGVVGFKVKPKPEDEKYWRVAIRGQHRDYLFPRSGKHNQALLEQIHALPKMPREVISEVLGHKSMFTSPGIHPFDDYILIKVPTSHWEAQRYEPLPDMIEITGTEYMKLSEVKKNAPVA